MACEHIVAVKNILITFTDCDTGQTIGPISHKESSEDLPTWRTCPWTNDRLPGGYTKRSAADATCNIKVIRDTRVPLAYYQGCATISLQVEMENGIVTTGRQGGVIGDNQSDGHEVEMDITFREVDEMLPPGALSLAA
jgi:hypothetical protein